MDVKPTGRFADPETEARYQTVSRTLRQPFVRLFGGLMIAMMVGYAVINPLFGDPDELLRLTLWTVGILLSLAGYVAATFWRDYPRQPMIDFMALLALSACVAFANSALFDSLIHQHQSMHAIGSINRLIITAFAAVALAGRFRLFGAWLVFDFFIYSAVALTQQHGQSGQVYALLSYISGALVMAAINIAIEKSSRGAFAMSVALDKERAKNEVMLHNVLPPVAAQRLKDGLVVADSYGDASVIFIDIVGFSMLAKRVSPGHLIELLNAFFSLADQCAARCNVEKVKTIGDAYLAISGGNVSSANSATSAIRFALEVIDGLEDIRRNTGIDVHIRVGVHSGPVVGGVIGETRMAYDYWGETMNIAARIEGTADADGIAVSETSYMRAHTSFRFSEPQTLLLKGVGETQVYKVAREIQAATPVPELAEAA